MFETSFKLANKKHTMASATVRQCASYWLGFTSPSNNEQDPIKMASFYKGSSN
jgi:hypothetical protein